MSTVNDLMTRNVLTIRPETTISQAVHILTQHGITSLPVVDQHDRLLGLICDSLLLRTIHEPELVARRVGDIMKQDVATTTTDTTIADVALIMLEQQLRRLPVVEEGRLVGLISRTHIMKYARQHRATQGHNRKASPLPTSKPHVLVLDSQEKMLELYRRLIVRSFGNCVELDTASDPQQARDWLVDHQCDLLIIDLDQPNFDGLELLSFAHEQNHWTQVILVGSNATWELLSQAMKLGAANFLLKPIEPIELVDLVNEAFSRWQRWARVVGKCVAGVQEDPEPNAMEELIASTTSHLPCGVF